MTGRACKENKGTTIQIIANLLEALTHVALDQLCAHEPRQILFALDSCVDHPHIPVHGRAEHYTSGLQHKAGNGGKRTAGGGQPPLGLVLIPNSKYCGLGPLLPVLQSRAYMGAVTAVDTGIRHLGIEKPLLIGNHFDSAPRAAAGARTAAGAVLFGRKMGRRGRDHGRTSDFFPIIPPRWA